MLYITWFTMKLSSGIDCWISAKHFNLVDIRTIASATLWIDSGTLTIIGTKNWSQRCKNYVISSRVTLPGTGNPKVRFI